MSVARHAVKAFSVALLFLFMAVAVSAQNIAELKKQAAAGDAKAQFNLGVMYFNGEGVPKDAAEAVRWFRKAAEQGLANAQYSLGLMYATGRGVSENDAESVRWFRKAAEQGYANAQYNLGVAYSNGEGVPKDEAEAYFWLNLGASTLDEKARAARDQVGKNLTLEKRQEIQERCRKWAETHPQNRE